MIKINLLPAEFRTVQKTTQNVPVVKIAIGAGCAFAALTVFFYFDYLLSLNKLRGVRKEWQVIQPRSAELKGLEEEVEGRLKPEKVFLERFVTTERALAAFMTWVSEYLPETSWLTELKMERKGQGGDLFIKGLAIGSKEKSSIEEIESYLHQLKEKIPDSNLSLTTTRQKIENTELTQFTANFNWGAPSAGAGTVQGKP
jgi:Tfp pilus assembly protein PilN